MSARGFPGRRLDWYRAGMIATTEASVSENGKLTGTENHNTNPSRLFSRV
jgi:hypothetical protein